MSVRTIIKLDDDQQNILVSIANALTSQGRTKKGAIQNSVKTLQSKLIESIRSAEDVEPRINTMTLQELEYVSILIEICEKEELGIAEDDSIVDSLKRRLNEAIADLASTAHLESAYPL